MSRQYHSIPAPRVISAQRCSDLLPVWLTEDDRWTTTRNEAERLTDDAVADDRLLDAMARRDEVCCPVLERA